MKHCWASFEFGKPTEKTHARLSDRIATYLAARLAELPMFSDVVVEPWRGDSAVHVKLEERPVYFFVSYTGLEAWSWVLCCTSERGFIRDTLFGSDAAQVAALADAIDTALRGNEKVSNIRWYPQGWSASEADEWTASPRQGTHRATDRR